MPICFDVYIFPREQEFEGEKTFLQLIELFENTSIPLTHRWDSFKIHGTELNRYVFESSKINTTEEIRKYFSRPRRKQPQKYSVGTGLLSNPADLASEEFPDAIAVDVGAWDSDYQYKHHDGYAQIGFFRYYTYWTTHHLPNGDPDPENEAVYERLKYLRTLITEVIEQLDPKSIKVFSDTGWQVPFNSHFTYFANPEVLLEDLEQIRAIFTGETVWNKDAPSFAEYDGPKMSFALNDRRTSEERERLWTSFRDWLPRLPALTPAMISEVWRLEPRQDGLQVSRTENGGALVFGSDNFMNTFVDQVYLEALELAGLYQTED
ncbi:MAG: hypothetical protein ACIAZJ_09465 [Gimesia chilikensis]|uniref:hypothetical protein n=1 Tax=Gimesia chilikensis TaxID=2605989 RepID=UPI00378859AD